MNGLKYIRVQCNLSINDLAGILGVTRQALSAWENGKKEIPKQRANELAEYFGLEAKYFTEVTGEDIKKIRETAMFRVDVNSKEAYRYKPADGCIDNNDEVMYFYDDREMTLDEEYNLVKKIKSKTLKEVENIIDWRSDLSRLDQIYITQRNCKMYDMVNVLMEKWRTNDIILKVPFFYELKSVLKAMLLAYGLIDISEIEYRDNENHCGEDGEWVIALSETLKEHWENEADFRKEQFRKAKERVRALKSNATTR